MLPLEPAVDSPPTEPLPTADSLRLNVSEEFLTVDTRLVDTGRTVRVEKTVHTHPVHVEESLTHDELDVRRVTVDRTLAPDEVAPIARYEGDTLIIPVFEEVLVVERRVRLKEEVHVTRIRHEKPFVETVQLKVEQVRIDRFDDRDGT